jgi:DNA primase
LEKAGLSVRVLRMQGAKDPDEFIRKFGRDAFSLLLERSENHIEYRLLSIRGKYSLETDEGRLGYLMDATDMLSKVENAVEREIYAVKIAEAAGVSAEAVKNEIKKAFKKRLAAEKKKKDKKDLNVAANYQPSDRAIRYDNVYSAAAEEGVIRLLVLDNMLFDVAAEFKLGEEDFTSPFLSKLYGLMHRRVNAGLDITPASLLTELPNAEASQFSVIIQRPESLPNGNKAMRDYITKIRAERLKKNAREDPLAVLQKYRDQSGCGG